MPYGMLSLAGQNEFGVSIGGRIADVGRRRRKGLGALTFTTSTSLTTVSERESARIIFTLEAAMYP